MINSSISEKTYTIALGVLEYAVGFEFSYNPNNTPQLEVMIDGVALDYSSEYLISEDGLDIVLLLLEGEEDNLRLVGSQLDIRRSIPLERNSDYQVGRIDPKQIEEDLDLAVERDQEIFNKFKYFLGLSNNQRNINLQELNLADDKRLIYFDYPTKTLKTTAFDYTGAFDHSLSLNRNLPHQHLAEAIDFDNGDTTVTDLQTKIESIIGSMAILGETSTTAYRGDRGKTAYDHSQLITGNPHGTTKTDLGLSNVDNTSDADKPVSIATSTALGLKETVANKGAANGYCGLDSGAKVPIANLPTTLLKYIGVWDASTNTPTLTSPDTTKKGNVYNVSVAGTQFGIAFKLGDWAIYNDSGVIEKSDNSDDVTSVNTRTGAVTGLAEDSAVVHNTGDETVAGIKTFSSFLITPSSAPTTDYQVANKKYVDDTAGSAATGIFLGTSSTASATAAKEVAITGFTLVTGKIVKITFTNKNTADVPTLNVEGTGAKAIYDEGGVAASSTSPAYFPAGAVIEFYYDGTNWVYINRVVTSYKSSVFFQRVFSNGWVEQGGTVTTSTVDYSITLLITMKTNTYFPTLTPYQATSTSDLTIRMLPSSTTDTLIIKTTVNGASLGFGVKWKIEGYAE